MAKQTFVYEVSKVTDNPHSDNAYLVLKKGKDNKTVDRYEVKVMPPMTSEVHVHCNCPGFYRQRYDKREHKHVKLVLRYIELGSPAVAVMSLLPNNDVEVLYTE